MVLGGEFDVLSTEIFFAVVGAQYDETRAAVLAVLLLFLVLVTFVLQNQWLGKKSYISITGKGDSGIHPLLPSPLKILIYTNNSSLGSYNIHNLYYDYIWRICRNVGSRS